MKKAIFIIVIVLCILLGIYGFNYFILTSPINQQVTSDIRNNGIDVDLHYEYYVNPNKLIFNIKNISGEKSKADIFRVLLQSAQSLKQLNFDTVKLAFKGKVKFLITGSYFKDLGQNFDSQNPMYTLRTFPENVYNVNGQLAYGRVEGGILGVLGAEMDNFNDFTDKWLLENNN